MNENDLSNIVQPFDSSALVVSASMLQSNKLIISQEGYVGGYDIVITDDFKSALFQTGVKATKEQMRKSLETVSPELREILAKLIDDCEVPYVGV